MQFSLNKIKSYLPEDTFTDDYQGSLAPELSILETFEYRYAVLVYIGMHLDEKSYYDSLNCSVSCLV